MPQRNVDLTEHFSNFIDEGILSGRFSDATEIVSEALALLERQEQEDQATLKALQVEAREGFDSLDRGDYITLSHGEELDTFMKNILEEVSAELPAA